MAVCSVRASWLGVVACIGGLLFGTLVSVANGWSAAMLLPVSLVLGVGWSWAALAVGIGALTRRRSSGGIAGAVALVFAVGGYYASDLVRGVYRYVDETDAAGKRTLTDWSGLASDLASWSAVALVAGCLLGLTGTGARHRDVSGLLCRLVVPAIAALEMLWRLSDEARSVAVATWSSVGTVAVLTGAALIVSYARTRRDRKLRASRP